MSKFDEIFRGPGKEDISIPPFDREEWIQQKKAEREKAFEMIAQAAEVMPTDGERVRTYLDLQSRFPRFSVGNILLLSIQKPDATRLADFKSWKEAGVFIRRGETGILILEPGGSYKKGDGTAGVRYNAKRVFDVSQTTSKAAPAPPVNRDSRLLLRALVYNAPCEIKVDGSVPIPENTAARYDSEHCTIYVARGQGGPALFREIARELAHAHMDLGDYDREPNAFAAMCVSYMICRRYHVDVSGFDFSRLPEDFRQMDSKAVRAELGKMRSAAINIETDMDKHFAKQAQAAARDEAR